MNFIKKFFRLYYDGFKSMKIGKTLWTVIAIKVILLYGVLKFFVFDENLKSLYPKEEEKIHFVLDNLTKDTK